MLPNVAVCVFVLRTFRLNFFMLFSGFDRGAIFPSLLFRDQLEDREVRHLPRVGGRRILDVLVKLRTG